LVGWLVEDSALLVLGPTIGHNLELFQSSNLLTSP